MRRLNVDERHRTIGQGEWAVQIEQELATFEMKTRRVAETYEDIRSSGPYVRRIVDERIFQKIGEQRFHPLEIFTHRKGGEEQTNGF